MTEFLVYAAILVAASLLFVLLPLWRAGTPSQGKRREANITVYYQRYDEIEREVAAGRIGRREAEEEKDQLGARLLADIDDTPALTERSAPPRKPWVISLLMVLVVVGVASGGYWQLGNHEALQADRGPDITAMLARLEEQVEQNPGDVQARLLLAQAQQATQQYAAAAKNFRAINANMDEPRPRLIAAEAESTFMARDDLQGRARTLFRQLLELDPDSTPALWYLGLGASERGDNAQALSYWDRLLKQDLPDDFARMVRGRRSELAGNKPQLDGDG